MLGQGPFETAIQLVRNHQPRRWYDDEREFRKDLASYLDGKMNCRPYQEFPHDLLSRKLDIELQFSQHRNIAIELKRDFDRRSFNELSGQLDQYSKVWNYIIVCSYGISNEEEWAEIQRNKAGGGWFNQTNIVFVPKRKPNQRQRRQNSRGGQQRRRGNNSGGIDWRDPFSHF